MKPFWEITPEEAEQCLEATSWTPAVLSISGAAAGHRDS